MKVARFKSGKYTIERPLHFGGALGNASELFISTLSSYGIPLGEAFQLRDDLLGVFGDSSQTGKPSGDDLKEGKRTAIIASAMEGATATQLGKLKSLIGDPNLSERDIADLQEIIIETGAQSHIESMITKLAKNSLDALTFEGLSIEGKKLLSDLFLISTNRKI